MTTARWKDTAIAAGVAAMLCIQVAAPFEPEALPPDWRAYALVIGIGAAMLARRRHPTGVLVASLVLLLAYYQFGFGAIGAVWPLAPALFNAALYGRWLQATTVGGSLLFGAAAYRLLIETETLTAATVSDVLSEGALGTAVILAGAMVRNHRRLSEEVRAREQAVAAERDAEARSRLTEQRLHIARDVHDIVAHSLAGIGVQARLAGELIDSDVEGARRSIRAAIDVTGEAMARLRETVGTLRGSPAVVPILEDLISGVTGVEVELVRDHGPYPEHVESTIVGIVREALTNVVRHSGAGRAAVTISGRPGSVTVAVADDGRGGEVVEGTGIRGMRERVTSGGGTLTAGPAPEGGFVVRAEIPT